MLPVMFLNVGIEMLHTDARVDAMRDTSPRNNTQRCVGFLAASCNLPPRYCRCYIDFEGMVSGLAAWTGY